jgi:hypothetical protein
MFGPRAEHHDGRARNWPDGSGLPVPLMFAGGAFDGTNVWLLPESADRLVYINVRGRTTTPLEISRATCSTRRAG